MKTKQQKTEELESGVKAIKASQTVVLADHTGLSVNDMNALRKSVFELGGSVMVLKKRLLKLVFQKMGLSVPEERYEGHVSAIISPKDVSETAALAYKFLREHKDSFKLVGAYNVPVKEYMDAELINRIGQLPSREVLLSQLVGMFAAPIRSFMFVLKEHAKKIS